MKKEPKPFVRFFIRVPVPPPFSLNSKDEFSFEARYFEDDSLCIMNNIVGTIVKKRDKEVKKNIPCYSSTGGKAWDLFYNYATFDGILNITEHSQHFEVYNYKNFAKEPECPDILTIFKKEGEKAVEDAISIYKRKMLEAIRDNPSLLEGGEFNVRRNTLIKVLKTARWSVGKEKAGEAREMLNKYLIPKKIGGNKKGRLPQPMFDMVIKLTVKLSEHLSKKYKCNLVYTRRNIKKEEELCKYNNFISWAKNSEKRMCNLSSGELKLLICSPSTFATNLVQKHFKVSTKTAKKVKQQTP